MKSTFVIALLLANVSAIRIEQSWPSVARCTAGQTSTDSFPCDHNNTQAHPHDGTTV